MKARNFFLNSRELVIVILRSGEIANWSIQIGKEHSAQRQDQYPRKRDDHKIVRFYNN